MRDVALNAVTNQGSRRKILITGGSGFIGTNCVDYFLRQGYEVLNLDRHSPLNPEQSQYWKECDVLDRERLISLFQGFVPEYLIHLAARTDLEEKRTLREYRANIEGVGNAIEATRQTPSVQRAIFASSRMVCQVGYRPEHDEDYCPPNLYGESKVLGERIVREADLSCEWTIVRPTSIWGPWFDVPYRIFFDLIWRGLYVNPAGRNPVKSFGFVGNTVDQLYKILQTSSEIVHGKTIYLCDYPPLHVREWADLIREALGGPRVHNAPFGLLRMAAVSGDILTRLGFNRVPLTSFRLKNLSTDMTFDTALLERICGTLHYNLAEGVSCTAEWMLRQEAGRRSVG